MTTHLELKSLLKLYSLLKRIRSCTSSLLNETDLFQSYAFISHLMKLFNAKAKKCHLFRLSFFNFKPVFWEYTRDTVLRPILNNVQIKNQTKLVKLSHNLRSKDFSMALFYCWSRNYSKYCASRNQITKRLRTYIYFDLFPYINQ